MPINPLNFVESRRTRGLLLAAGGMGALLLGRKAAATGMFMRGAADLESEWRANHPEFSGSLEDRWSAALAFYEQTHKHPVNRTLHVVGIPMIAGGAAGLILFAPFRPLWFLSAGSFTAGWALNFIGHGLYEKAAPAFADDPLAFIAGPVWDMKQLLGVRKASKDDAGADVVDLHARTV
jgi:hypothetical protein